MNALPDLVAHADWSKNPNKRWVAVAVHQHDGIYEAQAPEKVEDTRLFLENLRNSCRPTATIMIGFDFPIGIPASYAIRCSVTDFLELLPKLGKGEWPDFYKPAETADQISVKRPFYPMKPGGSRRSYLTESLLGHDNFDDLLRLCERGYDGRRSACPLFWTLGGQQVGKAAISGWQSVIQPALVKDPDQTRIWPFDGSLSSLLSETGVTIIAETYPAEFYTHLNIGLYSKQSPGEVTNQPSSGKRDQRSRKNISPILLKWSRETDVRLTSQLNDEIIHGFSPSTKGEDPFDAVIGLFGMLNILLGHHPPGDPMSEEQKRIEGWILGQTKFSPR